MENSTTMPTKGLVRGGTLGNNGRFTGCGAVWLNVLNLFRREIKHGEHRGCLRRAEPLLELAARLSPNHGRTGAGFRPGQGRSEEEK